MSEYEVIVAIDPGTDKSGIAVFIGSELITLESKTLPELVELIKETGEIFVVEDVESNKFIYNRNQKNSKGAGLQVAQSVGMVKATARHIISFLNHHHKTVIKIPPTTGNWGTINSKIGAQALKATLGWNKKSNKDTRSAAFFGHKYNQLKKAGALRTGV